MLGVSIETLRRWETEGRLHMERSEGGQRLIEIDEVARLLDERRKAATDRPIVAQSARNRFPGIVTRVETRRRRGGRRGHRRPAPAGQPDDGRGDRRPRPEGRRRSGLRRQGDQRHRRDPIVEGVTSMRVRLADPARRPGRGPGAPARAAPRRRAPPPRRGRQRPGERGREPRRQRRADDLCAPRRSRAPSTRPRRPTKRRTRERP